MNRNDYFKDPALSRGLLLKFKDSSRTGKALIEQAKDSKEMSFGRAFHYYMEGEESFKKSVFVMPPDNDIILEIGGLKPRGTKKYREWKESQIFNSVDKEIITEEEFSTIKRMSDNIKATTFYKSLMAVAKTQGNISKEKSYYTTINGKNYKCLVDLNIELPDKVIAIDWKTTSSKLSRENAAEYEIKKWDLHFQDCHYSKVIKEATGKAVSFIFFFVEKDNGNEVLPVIISEDSDLKTEAMIMWDEAVKNYDDYLNGNIKGIDDKLERGILIL